MIKICCECGKVIGEIPPLEDPSPSHGICRPCAKRVYGHTRESHQAEAQTEVPEEDHDDSESFHHSKGPHPEEEE